MRCEAVRRALSNELDGEALQTRVMKHLASCDTCPSYRAALQRLRQQSTALVSETAPDLSSRILNNLPSRSGSPQPSRRWLAPVAGLAAGVLIGVVLVGGVSGPSVSYAGQLSEAVVAAQSAISQMSASFVIREHIRAGVERNYDGALAFESPEYLSLQIEQTSGPPGWPDNTVSLIVNETMSVAFFPFPCPTLGGCGEASEQGILTTGRDPFSVTSPAPLDAIVPITVLRNTSEPPRLPGRTLLDRETVGFEVTAAQARSLLDAFFGIGNWRQIHDTDVVDVWLDSEFLTPLLITVSASDNQDRATWAARRGYEDSPSEPYLSVEYRAIGFGPITRTETAPSADAVGRDAGYRPGSALPPIDPGMPQVAAGAINGLVLSEVWAWSDGRAWIRLDQTSNWDGPGLFGNRGAAYPVETAIGTVYVAGDGSAVFVHVDGFDAVVSGSVETERLVEVAASLSISAIEVPSGWPEAPAPEEVTDQAYLPSNLRGFADPIIREIDGSIVLDLFGGGNRSVRVTQRVGDLLSPPLDPDARAVPLRSTVGRYSPMLGLLEWIEDGFSFSIQARALSVDEMVTIAASLVAPAER